MRLARWVAIVGALVAVGAGAGFFVSLLRPRKLGQSTPPAS